VLGPVYINFLPPFFIDLSVPKCKFLKCPIDAKSSGQASHILQLVVLESNFLLHRVKVATALAYTVLNHQDYLIIISETLGQIILRNIR
jgi:hypothetical protein